MTSRPTNQCARGAGHGDEVGQTTERGSHDWHERWPMGSEKQRVGGEKGGASGAPLPQRRDAAGSRPGPGGCGDSVQDQGMGGHPTRQRQLKAPEPLPALSPPWKGAWRRRDPTPTQQGASAETTRSSRHQRQQHPGDPPRPSRTLPVPLEMPALAAAPTETRTDPGAAEKYV